MFGVVEITILNIGDGKLNPVIGKEPGVPDNAITRLQIFICHMRTVFYCVIHAIPLTESCEREQANPLAEASLGTFIDFGSPCVDQVPNLVLVLLGHLLDPFDEIAERLLIMLWPCERKIKRFTIEPINFLPQYWLASTRSIATPMWLVAVIPHAGSGS